MLRVLLTSFEPFGGHDRNSSLEVGRALAQRPPAGIVLDWLLLPVVAGACTEQAWARIEQTRPDVVLTLGQATGAAAVRLEEFAVNVAHFTMPDNAGNQPQHQPIVPDGPPAYRATTQPHRLAEALQQAGVPVERSYHAGTYVCNHLFYGLLHRSARSGAAPPVGFIHLPLLPEQVHARRAVPTCALDLLVAGVGRAIHACATGGTQ
jgi:pyroglutamyl-peptidase